MISTTIDAAGPSDAGGMSRPQSMVTFDVRGSGPVIEIDRESVDLGWGDKNSYNFV